MSDDATIHVGPLPDVVCSVTSYPDGIEVVVNRRLNSEEAKMLSEALLLAAGQLHELTVSPLLTVTRH
jgi:hypothetical protein